VSAEACIETTASGERCKNSALPGSARCQVHHRGTQISEKSRGGRPSKLTPEVVETLVQMLRAGNYVGVACHAVRITRQTFALWMKRGRSARPEDAPYRDFRERVEQARAEGEVRNVTHIASAARESWQAAAWLLERQYPERWGRPSSPQRQEAPAEDAPREAEFDPFAEVDELAERRRQTRTL
jgi:hypothetical protein